MVEAEADLTLKELFVPEYLLCTISGDFMADPVTIGSGRTFDRENIEMYWDIQRNRAERDEADFDPDEHKENEQYPAVFDAASYMNCPVTLQVVDEDIKVSNKGIKQANESFIKHNPKAF